MDPLMIWIAFGVMGLLTFLTRLSFIAIFDKVEPPRNLQKALRFVPIAVLSAIVSPEIFYSNDHFIWSLNNPKIFAAMVATLIALKTKNVLFTIIAGMATFWLLKFFIFPLWF